MTRVILALAVLLSPACSERASDDAGAEAGSQDAGQAEANDEARIIPEGLEVSALPGGNGVLEVVALTLRMVSDHLELYAALRNVGDVPACSAALSVELFDEQAQSLTAGIDGLLTAHFYRRNDDSGAIAACVGPGDLTMAAITDLRGEIDLADVRSVVYRCPYFALDVTPIAGLTITDVERVARDGGTTYRGSLRNELSVALRSPSVTLFPVNGVGRPLAVARGSGTGEIAPGASWRFETDAVSESGLDYVAFPAGALDVAAAPGVDAGQ